MLLIFYHFYHHHRILLPTIWLYSQQQITSYCDKLRSRFLFQTFLNLSFGLSPSASSSWLIASYHSSFSRHGPTCEGDDGEALTIYACGIGASYQLSISYYGCPLSVKNMSQAALAVHSIALPSVDVPVSLLCSSLAKTHISGILILVFMVSFRVFHDLF